VQLIDSESGKHLWAERFEKPIAIFSSPAFAAPAGRVYRRRPEKKTAW
jgi:hypothetical protein